MESYVLDIVYRTRLLLYCKFALYVPSVLFYMFKSIDVFFKICKEPLKVTTG